VKIATRVERESMTLVVDASVAVKWVLPEVGSERAVAIRTTDEDLIAPSLACAEIGSAIWRAALRGDLAAAEAREYLKIAIAHYQRIILLEELTDAAITLAIRLKHPIYDCFYLALAERERCTLVTADARLIAAAKGIRNVEVRAL
jgi:predicted nucleic acid-binding protein